MGGISWPWMMRSMSARMSSRKWSSFASTAILLDIETVRQVGRRLMGDASARRGSGGSPMMLERSAIVPEAPSTPVPLFCTLVFTSNQGFGNADVFAPLGPPLTPAPAPPETQGKRQDMPRGASQTWFHSTGEKSSGNPGSSPYLVVCLAVGREDGPFWSWRHWGRQVHQPQEDEYSPGC